MESKSGGLALSFVDEKHLRMRQDIEEQTRLAPFVFLDKAMIIYHQAAAKIKWKEPPPPKKKKSSHIDT